MCEQEWGLDVDSSLDGMVAPEAPLLLMCYLISAALWGGNVGEGTAPWVGGFMELAHHINKIILYIDRNNRSSRRQ